MTEPTEPRRRWRTTPIDPRLSPEVLRRLSRSEPAEETGEAAEAEPDEHDPRGC